MKMVELAKRELESLLAKGNNGLEEVKSFLLENKDDLKSIGKYDEVVQFTIDSADHTIQQEIKDIVHFINQAQIVNISTSSNSSEEYIDFSSQTPMQLFDYFKKLSSLEAYNKFFTSLDPEVTKDFLTFALRRIDVTAIQNLKQTVLKENEYSLQQIDQKLAILGIGAKISDADEDNEDSPFMSLSTGKRINLSHEQIIKLRESHLKPQEFLDKKIEELQDNEVDKIAVVDELATDALKSSNLFVGLYDGIQKCLKDSAYQDIKLIQFLEGFYQRAPINKLYTEETHELYFKNAVEHAMSLTEETNGLLGDMYHDYFDIN